MKIWEIVKTQVLIAPMGVYALDLGSITQVLLSLGIDDIPGELNRLHMIFDHVYGKNK